MIFQVFVITWIFSEIWKWIKLIRKNENLISNLQELKVRSLSRRADGGIYVRWGSGKRFRSSISLKLEKSREEMTIQENRNDCYSSASFLFPFSLIGSFDGLISVSNNSRGKKIKSSCWARNWLMDCFDWRADWARSFWNRGRVD